MSTTSSPTLASPHVSEFATAVRAALSDLAPDEIDDLTDGLEADLTERLDDGPSVELGDPVAYAEELRAAAGLPHRATGRAGLAGAWARLGTAPASIATRVRTTVAGHPLLARALEFLVTLRPVWWLFRAVVVTELLVIALAGAPVTGVAVIVGLGILVLSVQFGRGRWLPFSWMRGLLLAVNVILVIAAPFVVASWATQINNAVYSQQYGDSYPDYSTSGLMENGNQVTNVFAYDAQGNPLTNVQLFDQDGKPLNLSGDPSAAFGQYSDDGTVTVPSDAVTGRPGWNVVPLAKVARSDIEAGDILAPSAHRTPADPPFAMAKELAGSQTQAVATPSPTPTATPTPAP